MKKKVLILGGTGMLGHGVIKSFYGDPNYDITVSVQPSSSKLIDKHPKHFSQVKTITYNALNKNLDDLCNIGSLLNPDYIINCIGIINRFTDDDHYVSAYINSAFPHLLSQWANKCDVKMIHITTDCVFSGLKGQYVEEDVHDATDFYGKSKSLGEPKDCMVLRTSIIGKELHKNVSLVSWVESQDKLTVKGYTNHLWNGVTTEEYGLICKKIIERDLYENKLYHIFSPHIYPKIELIKLIADQLRVDINIEPEETKVWCDRSLFTTRSLCHELMIPPLEEQLKRIGGKK